MTFDTHLLKPIFGVTNRGECQISLETFAECDIKIVGMSCGQIAAKNFALQSYTYWPSQNMQRKWWVV